MKKTKPDWIFECYKCEHELYVTKKHIAHLLKTDCPHCGEEAHRNWILIGEGDFNKQ